MKYFFDSRFAWWDFIAIERGKSQPHLRKRMWLSEIGYARELQNTCLRQMRKALPWSLVQYGERLLLQSWLTRN